jgi:hypothetical protein
MVAVADKMVQSSGGGWDIEGDARVAGIRQLEALPGRRTDYAKRNQNVGVGIRDAGNRMVVDEGES